MAKKAHQQKVEEETADAQKAMQRNSETMAAFVQQLAQPKAQAMAQPGIARKGGFFFPIPMLWKKGIDVSRDCPASTLFQF